MTWLRLALVKLVVVLTIAAQGPSRHYWPVTVDQLASGTVKHTHVQVSGRVKLVRHEADGDLHIQLTGVKAFIVAECIPRMPCVPPAVGSVITVRGISRYDGEHHWWECHPVEQIAQGRVH